MKRKIVSIFLITTMLITAMMPVMFAKTAQEKKEELQDKLQKLTDKYIQVIEKLMDEQSQAIMKV